MSLELSQQQVCSSYQNMDKNELLRWKNVEHSQIQGKAWLLETADQVLKANESTRNPNFRGYFSKMLIKGIIL